MQQPAEDPLDYFSDSERGSLLIYERICPSATPDPIMSRRVFDVGLDIGRIKNGLHRRQEAKRTRSGHAASASEPSHDDIGDQDKQLVPRTPRKKSNPNARGVEYHQNGPADDAGFRPSAESSGPGTSADDFPHPPIAPNGNHMSPETEMLPLPSPHAEAAGPVNFDLNPPAPRKPVKMLDSLSERLFSDEHLRVILRDPTFFMRFTAFLNRYTPSYSPILLRYLEAQKAIKAVEYANAVAESLRPLSGDEASKIPCAAATVDARFEQRSKRAFETLVNEALPAYVTFYLVKVVTESMVREITGTTMPFMRELVGGLAEVFCLADPSMPDTPIVYASEEFYRTTQYGRDYVIGKNCRFLQGPKTNRKAVERLGRAIKAGQEASETILNYRRGGEPFMNLLMTAPLYDNRGTVRYIIGAQVDISGLVEDGRGLDSFERSLNDRSKASKDRNSSELGDTIARKTLRKLNELGQMLSVDESSVLERSHSRGSSVNDGLRSEKDSIRGSTRREREYGPRPGRRMLGNEEEDQPEGWALSSSGPSGKLPGVYQNVSFLVACLPSSKIPKSARFLWICAKMTMQYLLVRPHPSMRIIFVSPALRIPGLLQSSFLSRIGGPGHVRDGLSEAFENGESVTAKITWLPQGRSDDNEYSRPGSRGGGGSDGGRTRYISCTPLLGSDDKVGVWMVVMVENEQVTGALPSRIRPRTEDRHGAEINGTGSEYEREDSVRQATNPTSAAAQQRSEARTPRTPKDRYVNGNTSNYSYTAPTSGTGNLSGESGRLYADFLRTQQTQSQSYSSPEQSSSPYGHRANEGLRRDQYQQQQSSNGHVVGPGKVSTESESEEMDRNGLVDGLGSPRLRGLDGERQRQRE